MKSEIYDINIKQNNKKSKKILKTVFVKNKEIQKG